MNESATHFISVRAIEDIIQIQKIMEDSSNLKNIELKKKKSNEAILYSAVKNDVYSPEATNYRLSCILKQCDIENSFQCNEKNVKNLDINGWEGDCALLKHIRPDVLILENTGNIEGACSNADVKCWSSDSDVTVLRVKKEFRNELSNRVEWEEQRNLTDDVSTSSINLDWESHSLINLAGVVDKEKEPQKGLTPFTIWSKTNNTTNSSMYLMEQMSSFSECKPSTPEIKLAVENGSLKVNKLKKLNLQKKKRLRNFFGSIFSCFSKKKIV